MFEPRPRFAMLRAATSSIEDSARMVDDVEPVDPIATLAITAATGRALVDSAGSKHRAQETITRYLARMGGRATPYGLFAGTALVHLGPERDLALGPTTAHRVRTRIDVAALEAALQDALTATTVHHWPLRVTPLARSEGSVVRFARPGDATADVVTVKTTAVITQVLHLLGDQVRYGAEVIDDLIAWRSELTVTQVATLLTQLVDVGLVERFTGVIEPGVEPAERAVDLLRRIGSTDQAEALLRLVDETCGVAALTPDLDRRWDRPWEQAASHIPALVSVPEGKRYDLQLELTGNRSRLDQQTVDDLISTVLRVQHVNSAASDTSDDTDPTSAGSGFSLPRFRAAFRARYEDAEVPLLAAVDLESGVLQPGHRQVSPLARDAGVISEHTETVPSVAPGVLKAYKRFAWSGHPVDISDFEPAPRLASRAILAALLDWHEGRHTSLLTGGVGRSPFSLMARFALGRDEVAARFTEQTAAEADQLTGDPDVIRAELVYHPGGRIGNVLVRPRVLPDTIALSGAGGGTLSLDRLTIRLFRDEFLLRDRVTGRPVVVELNTAHNVDLSNLDPVYAVLGRLAGSGGAGWSWGALGRLDHLPRVTCGRVIVTPEQWLVAGSRLREICAQPEPGPRLREELKLTDQRRWLGIGSFDHILPIDLRSARSVRAMLARAADHEQVRLVEMPQVESPAVTSPRGHHVAEVVVPVGAALRPAARPPADDAFFCPDSGARWVYVRFHCGQSSADHVVIRAAALAHRLAEEGAVTDWFFVRYVSEGYHVRVRMRARTMAERERVLVELSSLGAEMRSDSLVGRVVIDDYVPEVARYGGQRTLQYAERLFSASSDRVARLLDRGPTEATRLYQAVADVLDWVRQVHDTPDEQIELLQSCQQGLSVSFAPRGNRQGKFFRQHRQGLDDYLATRVADPGVHQVVDELVAAIRDPATAARMVTVFGSCLHMHCNRLFAFDAVRLEYLTYDLSIRKIRERSARGASSQHEPRSQALTAGTTSQVGNQR